MIARIVATGCLLASLGCSSTSANTLSGSESQVYDLSFDQVIIELQGTDVSVKYVGSDSDPAILVVNTADIVNVANSQINLAMPFLGQQRGVLQNVDTNNVTNQLTIQNGNATFDSVPKVGDSLSGQFNALLTDGYTLNGTFSGTVNGPSP